MQIRHWLMQALTITLLCGWSSLAIAQFGGTSQPGSSPTFSPYLNLLRGGSSGVGMNYFGLVRPQQQFSQQTQQLGNGIQSLQMQGGNIPTNSANYGYSQLGVTGHPVIFNSFGNGQFSGGYTGFGGGGAGGGGFGGGGFNQGGLGGGSFGGGGFGGGGFNQGGGFGGGGFNQGGGFGGGSQFGNQANFGGIGTTGGGFGNIPSAFGGFSGHPAQFGGIGNTYRQGR